MYAILGSGRFAYEFVRGLDIDSKNILVIDEDENNLTDLKNQGFSAIKVDKLSSDVIRSNVKPRDQVFILGEDAKTNLDLVRMTKEHFPDVTIVANAPEREIEDEMGKFKGVVPIRISDSITNALKMALETRIKEKTATLLRKILQRAGPGNIAIFTHNNPDPDSMASALAFSAICENEDLSSKIYHGGEISHQENLELVRLLKIELHQIQNEDELAVALNNASKVVMIETAVAGENNVLPKDFVPNIVLDHHPTSREITASDMVDVRSDVGALSSILTIYLQQLDVKVNQKLATALLYALKVDTKSFTRKVSPTDLRAAAFLSPFADENLLKRIESPPMSPTTMDVIGNAIVNREVKKGVMFSAVGYVEERDALPQAAEFLLRESEVKVVGLCGIRGYNIHISARSNDPSVHLGEVVTKAFSDLGSAGGHAGSAGVQISLDRVNIEDKSDKELIANEVANMCRKIFFTGFGIDISTKTV
jgi:nanoRNase/pAp phosphatase (c-di-AMP/oligoRNAs hydrolase)